MSTVQVGPSVYLTGWRQVSVSRVVRLFRRRSSLVIIELLFLFQRFDDCSLAIRVVSTTVVAARRGRRSNCVFRSVLLSSHTDGNTDTLVECIMQDFAPVFLSKTTLLWAVDRPHNDSECSLPTRWIKNYSRVNLINSDTVRQLRGYYRNWRKALSFYTCQCFANKLSDKMNLIGY